VYVLGVKVLVSGSRKWLAQIPIEQRLRKLPPGTTVIHGGQRGVDQIAADVAKRLGFTVREYLAEAHGRKWPEAGPLRNREMLAKEHPSPDGEYIDLALFFHEDPELGKGTKDMKSLVVAARPVIETETKIGRGR